jgi:AAA15 family ATPase/GTPase
MLHSFSVKNFKGFRDEITLDLSKVKNYEFNTEVIRNGLINTALIYGYNGVGKSNLALAVMDIILHLTDKNKRPELYDNYLNVDGTEPIAEFSYSFKLNDSLLIYQYGKQNYESLIYEKVIIDDKEIISYDRRNNHPVKIELSGTETLNKNPEQIKISVLKYIKGNAVLNESKEAAIFIEFLNFVDNMLLFWNRDERGYQGYDVGSGELSKGIIEANHFDDFKEFLKRAGLDSNIIFEKKNDKYEMYYTFTNKKIDFWDSASTGAKALTLFYYWIQRVQYGENPPSLVFIDEFDAFYHSELSHFIIKEIKKIERCQFILTTHDTTVMTNELLRPDCYFLMYKDRVQSLAESTNKELRFAHNLEKIYRSGLRNE